MRADNTNCRKELIMANAKDIVYPKKRAKQKVNSKEFIKISSKIKHNGMMEPIVVKLNDNSELEIISGEIRFDAALLAGMNEIPCLVMNCDDDYGQVFTMVEELKKSDLDMFEEATMLDILVNKNKLSKRETANMLGKTVSEVSLSIELNKFGEEEKFIIRENYIDKTQVMVLSAIDDFIYRRKALDEVIRKRLNLEQTNSVVNKYLRQISKYRERELRKNIMSEELKLFMAGLQKTIDMVTSLGIDTRVSKSESEDYIECIVRIAKNTKKAKIA